MPFLLFQGLQTKVPIRIMSEMGGLWDHIRWRGLSYIEGPRPHWKGAPTMWDPANHCHRTGSTVTSTYFSFFQKNEKSRTLYEIDFFNTGQKKVLNVVCSAFQSKHSRAWDCKPLGAMSTLLYTYLFPPAHSAPALEKPSMFWQPAFGNSMSPIVGKLLENQKFNKLQYLFLVRDTQLPLPPPIALESNHPWH